MSLENLLRSFESGLFMEINRGINVLLVLSSDPELVIPIRSYPKIFHHLISIYRQSHDFVLYHKKHFPHLFNLMKDESGGGEQDFYEMVMAMERDRTDLFHNDVASGGFDYRTSSQNRIEYHRERMVAISLIMSNLSFHESNRMYLSEHEESFAWSLMVLETAIDAQDPWIVVQAFKHAFIFLSHIVGYHLAHSPALCTA